MYCCSFAVSVRNLVKNFDSTPCFVPELYSLGENFAFCFNVYCTIHRTQTQYILIDFSLIHCQGSTVTIS
jgi:hypothetical protein